MRRASWLPLILTLAFLLGPVTGVAAQRPDGHGAASRAGTEEGADIDPGAGCDIVGTYYDELWDAIGNSGAFANFLLSDARIGELSRSDAEAVIADGEDLIVAMDALDVPGAYVVGHEGMTQFFQHYSDIARFYGIDSSVVPDLNAIDQSRLMILEGEAAIAASCPEEVEMIGGYILFAPEDSEDGFDPVD